MVPTSSSAGEVLPLRHTGNLRRAVACAFARARNKEKSHEEAFIRAAAFDKCGRWGGPGAGRAHRPDAAHIGDPGQPCRGHAGVERHGGWRDDGGRNDGFPGKPARNDGPHDRHDADDDHDAGRLGRDGARGGLPDDGRIAGRDDGHPVPVALATPGGHRAPRRSLDRPRLQWSGRSGEHATNHGEAGA